VSPDEHYQACVFLTPTEISLFAHRKPMTGVRCLASLMRIVKLACLDPEIGTAIVERRQPSFAKSCRSQRSIKLHWTTRYTCLLYCNTIASVTVSVNLGGICFVAPQKVDDGSLAGILCCRHAGSGQHHGSPNARAGVCVPHMALILLIVPNSPYVAGNAGAPPADWTLYDTV
jgi:hypothetical protein